MADNTRLKVTEELSRKNETRITEISSHLKTFEERVEKRFDELLKTINDNFARDREGGKDSIPENVEIRDSPCRIVGQSSRSDEKSNWSYNGNGNQAKQPKVNFPIFDGTNPRNWVRKCKKYFNIHPLNDAQRMDMVSLHVEGRADTWFHDYHESHPTSSWDQFVLDVFERFQEGGYDFVGEFNKLSQKGSVEEYQESFEELKAFMVTKHRALDEDYFISSFISGLKEEIAKMVLLLHPTSLNQAFYMAKMQESILVSNGKGTKTPSRPYNYGVASYYANSKDSHSTKPNQPTSSANVTFKSASTSASKAATTNSQPIKRLSYAEMRVRREKGLCYNCDEMFKPGHKCKQQQLFMIVGDDDDIEEDDKAESEALFDEHTEDIEVSVHALSGNTSPNTIRIQELKRSLYALFSQYGRILDIVALKTEKLRGQAWLVFSEVTAASNAVRQMQNFPFYDKPMRIQYAKTKSDCVAKADGSYVPGDKKRKQEEKSEKRKRGDEAQQSGGANGTRADTNGGPTATFRQGKPTAQEAAAAPNNILFIQNLPHETTDTMLEVLFKQYPGFREVRMIDAKPGIAFVEFEDDIQSSVAMQALQGFKIAPQNPMVITYAKK